jgi:hypothetical protein
MSAHAPRAVALYPRQVRIKIELEWDSGAQTFVGSWNNKLLALPHDALPDTGSAFDTVAEYKPGGVQIVTLEGPTQHPRAVLAGALLSKNKPADAVARLATISREVLARDPTVQALRARAYAAVSDVAAALADLDAVLAAPGLPQAAGYEVHSLLKVLPGPAVRVRMAGVRKHLAGMDPPLVGVRDLPDDAWTKDILVDVLRSHAAATTSHPHIIEELVEQARRIGASQAEIDVALGSVSKQIADTRQMISQREELAGDHASACLLASKTPGAIARMIALLRNPDPGLVAAIQVDDSYSTEDELAEQRRTLQIELAPPAPAGALSGLPDELAALLVLANGVRRSESDEQLLDAERVKSLAKELELAGVFPFASNGSGGYVALRHGRVIGIDRGQVDDLADSLAVWLCAYVASGLRATGAAVTLRGWKAED